MKIFTDGSWSADIAAMQRDICEKVLKIRVDFNSEMDNIIIDGSLIDWSDYFLQLGGMNAAKTRYEVVINKKEADGSLDRSKFIFGITINLDTESLIIFHGNDSIAQMEVTFK
jgi:hypothetical protein